MNNFDQIGQYIDSQLNKGKSLADVKKDMRKSGYSQSDINYHIQKHIKAHSGFFQKNYGIIVALGVMLILFFLVFGIASILGPSFCDNIGCFVETANDCGEGMFIQEEETLTLEYSIKNCVLTKRVIDVSVEEPLEVQELFLEKQMQCPYDIFNENLINGFLEDIDECEGNLKEIIVQIRDLT